MDLLNDALLETMSMLDEHERASDAAFCRQAARNITSKLRGVPSNISYSEVSQDELKNVFGTLTILMEKANNSMELYAFSNKGLNRSNENKTITSSKFKSNDMMFGNDDEDDELLNDSYNSIDPINGNPKTRYISLCFSIVSASIRIIQQLDPVIAFSNNEQIDSLTDCLISFLIAIFSNVFNHMSTNERILFVPSLVNDISAIFMTPRLFSSQRPSRIATLIDYFVKSTISLDLDKSINAINRYSTAVLNSFDKIMETYKLHYLKQSAIKDTNIFIKSSIICIYFSIKFFTESAERFTKGPIRKGIEKLLYEKEIELNENGMVVDSINNIFGDESEDYEEEADLFTAKESENVLQVLNTIFKTTGKLLGTLAYKDFEYCIPNSKNNDKDLKWVYRSYISIDKFIIDSLINVNDCYRLSLNLRNCLVTDFLNKIQSLKSIDTLTKAYLGNSYISLQLINGILKSFNFKSYLDLIKLLSNNQNKLLNECGSATVLTEICFQSFEKIDWGTVILGPNGGAASLCNVFDSICKTFSDIILSLPINEYEARKINLFIERELLSFSIRSVTGVSSYAILQIYSTIIKESGISRCNLLLTTLAGLSKNYNSLSFIFQHFIKMLEPIKLSDGLGILQSNELNINGYNITPNLYFFGSMLNSVDSPNTINLIKYLETYILTIFSFIGKVQESENNNTTILTIKLFNEFGMVANLLSKSFYKMNKDEFLNFLSGNDNLIPKSQIVSIISILPTILEGSSEILASSIKTNNEACILQTLEAISSLWKLSYSMVPLTFNAEDGNALSEALVESISKTNVVSILPLLKPVLKTFINQILDKSKQPNITLLKNITKIIYLIFNQLEFNQELSEYILLYSIFKESNELFEKTKSLINPNFNIGIPLWKLFVDSNSASLSKDSSDDIPFLIVESVRSKLIPNRSYQILNTIFTEFEGISSLNENSAINKLLKSTNGNNLKIIKQQINIKNNEAYKKLDSQLIIPNPHLSDRIAADVWNSFSLSNISPYTKADDTNGKLQNLLNITDDLAKSAII